MSEFEDKINSILSSPEEMQKIMEMARMLSGDGDNGGEMPAPNLGGIDPNMLGTITRLLGQNSTGESDKFALINAMTPFLTPQRRQTLEQAVQIARMARIARLAMTEFSDRGGEGGV